jgi:hypothetical protein
MYIYQSCNLFQLHPKFTYFKAASPDPDKPVDIDVTEVQQERGIPGGHPALASPDDRPTDFDFDRNQQKRIFEGMPSHLFSNL